MKFNLKAAVLALFVINLFVGAFLHAHAADASEGITQVKVSAEANLHQDTDSPEKGEFSKDCKDCICHGACKTLVNISGNIHEPVLRKTPLVSSLSILYSRSSSPPKQPPKA